MMNPQPPKTQVLLEASVPRKLAAIDACLQGLLQGLAVNVPAAPGRDVQILAIRDLPDKKGLSTREGQARLIHDLASIELQAMELGLRTLAEFPEAPPAFREELAEVTRDEGRHLQLCLTALEDLGLPWGSFPTHIALWQAVSGEDSLLDRVLIVHRYLEGSGLDASDKLLRRLTGVNAVAALRAVEVIRREEVGHVLFGSRWYHKLCLSEGLDPAEDFGRRLEKLSVRIPRRMEPVRADLRTAGGFTGPEIEALEALRARGGAGVREASVSQAVANRGAAICDASALSSETHYGIRRS